MSNIVHLKIKDNMNINFTDTWSRLRPYLARSVPMAKYKSERSPSEYRKHLNTRLESYSPI